MTREEKQKAIDALKISAPLMVMTHKEYTDYKRTLDDIMELLEQEPCDDAISRQAVLDLIEHYNSDGLGSVFYGYEEGKKFANAVKKLSPINPQEPASWCTDCKEYDQDEYCCHRFSKVIRDTVEEMKQESVLDKIKEEVKSWYRQADKQKLAEDPCVVDAMVDLFIRTIDKCKAEMEE